VKVNSIAAIAVEICILSFRFAMDI
jgi:hypothetical protein